MLAVALRIDSPNPNDEPPTDAGHVFLASTTLPAMVAGLGTLLAVGLMERWRWTRAAGALYFDVAAALVTTGLVYGADDPSAFDRTVGALGLLFFVATTAVYASGRGGATASSDRSAAVGG